MTITMVLVCEDDEHIWTLWCKAIPLLGTYDVQKSQPWSRWKNPCRWMFERILSWNMMAILYSESLCIQVHKLAVRRMRLKVEIKLGCNWHYLSFYFRAVAFTTLVTFPVVNFFLTLLCLQLQCEGEGNEQWNLSLKCINVIVSST